MAGAAWGIDTTFKCTVLAASRWPEDRRISRYSAPWQWCMADTHQRPNASWHGISIKSEVSLESLGTVLCRWESLTKGICKGSSNHKKNSQTRPPKMPKPVRLDGLPPRSSSQDHPGHGASSWSWTTSPIWRPSLHKKIWKGCPRRCWWKWKCSTCAYVVVWVGGLEVWELMILWTWNQSNTIKPCKYKLNSTFKITITQIAIISFLLIIETLYTWENKFTIISLGCLLYCWQFIFSFRTYMFNTWANMEYA